jgi:hypothetical protein
MYKLLNVSQNSKTIKGEKKGYLTGILYLAPYTVAGINDSEGKPVNTCPASNEACRKACLFTSGLAGIFKSINEARIKKTKRLFEDTENFLKDIKRDIMILKADAESKGMTPVVRLNGTSDLNWSDYKLDGKTIFELFPEVQFYDYTKRVDLFSNVPSNLHLTFSYSGTNNKLSEKILSMGYNVTAVVSTKQAKEYFLEDNEHFIDGDNDDLRFTDEKGKIVLLTAKGQAKKDDLGFLIA